MASVPNETTSVSGNDKLISVAVIGGGIGGLCLAIGLLKHRHLDVQVYEAAPAFGEIGAGVAFSPNAERAMELIGPAALKAFQKHATPNMWSSYANTWARFRVGVGEKEGTVIGEAQNSMGMQSLHRAHFLEELVKAVPAQRAHFNKRLENLEQDSEGVTLHFKDGQSISADNHIGADGVHSHTRRYLVGEEPAKPQYSGSVAHRGLIPMDSAVEAIGEELAQNCQMHLGPHRMILTYPIDFGKILNVVALDFQDHWPHEKWIMPTRYDVLQQRYSGWGKAAQGIIKLLDTPDLATWSLWDSSPVATFAKGRVAMMGDAAHASTPYHGQGAAQAIEDACVLQALLGKVHDKKHIPNALSAFDQIRRPRAEHNVTTSRESGLLFTMQLDGVNDDLAKMKETLDGRFNWLWHRNIPGQNQAALDLFEESL